METDAKYNRERDVEVDRMLQLASYAAAAFQDRGRTINSLLVSLLKYIRR